MSQRELNHILDEMEDKRENFQSRPRIPQFDGFRTEWSNYLEENIENLYQS